MVQSKVSFVLVCYQQEEFIRDAVRSALAQQYEPLEIIISDDCSDDSTFAIIEEEVAAYRGPHQIKTNRNSTNLGIGHLSELMPKMAGDFIVIAHGDDISMPNRTHRLVEAWIQKKTSLVSSNAMMVDAECRPLGLLCQIETDQDIPVEEIIAENWDYTRLGATFACDREVFSRFAPIDKKKITHGDDHFLPFRAGLLNGMYYLGEPLIQWRQHDRNVSDRLSNKRSSLLVRSETDAAYNVAARIFMFDELLKFRETHDDAARMKELQSKLVVAIIKKTRRWTRDRVSLTLDGLLPTWVDKDELEEKPIDESLRMQPQVPIKGSS